MHFDLTDLRLFLAVAEAGSITRGGAAAGLALASASARLRGMEDQAGLALLQRGRRGVTVTPAGAVLLHHARLVLRQMAHLRGDLGEHAGGLRGQVRLLANTAALAEALPEALASFLALHPLLDIDLGERPSGIVAREVAEDRADIGVAADHADFSGLQRLPFGRDRLVLVAPPGHALADRDTLTLAEALEADFVGLGGDSALQTHLAGHAARAGGRMRLRAQVASLDIVCRMVLAGAGIAVVPEAAARRLAGLRVLRLRDPWAERGLWLVLRRREALPQPAQRLVDHLLACAHGP